MERKLQIGVIGGREVSSALLKMAEKVGQQIARRHAVLVCGGLGGVMEAACRGAKSADGLTVGILPVADAKEANAYVDVVIPTGMGVARNAIIIHASDGIIAIGGSYGTLSEMAFASQMGVPLVSLKSWVFDQTLLTAESPEAAVEKLFEMLNKVK